MSKETFVNVQLDLFTEWIGNAALNPVENAFHVIPLAFDAQVQVRLSVRHAW